MRYDSLFSQKLRTSKWILNSSDELVSADNLTIQTLSDRYEKNSAAVSELINFLNIKDEQELQLNEEIEHDDSNLTSTQREDINLGRKAKELGLTEEELVEFARLKAEREKDGKSTSGSVVDSSDFYYSDSIKENVVDT